MSVQGLQKEIAANLSDLKSARGDEGKVYFIEHQVDVDILIETVKERFGVDKSFNFATWSAYPLPLICLLAEVGYEYKGNGTDFWPLASAKVSYVSAFDSADVRKFIASLFSTNAARYGAAVPDLTGSWASRFKYIAWPIHHAVLPQDHQVALIEFIARRRESIELERLTDDGLYSWIMASSQRHSNRFTSWLEQRSVVAAITRALFGGEQGILERRFVDRVIADLSRALEGRAYLLDAARQRLIQQPTPRLDPQHLEQDAASQGGYIVAHVFEERSLTLSLFLPRLEPDLERRVAAALRRRFYTPRLWGSTAPINLSVFLRGEGIPLLLQGDIIPSGDTPLLTDLPTELSEDDRSALLDRSISWELPKFLIDDGDGVYTERVGSIIYHGEQLVLLTTAAEAPDIAGIQLLEHQGPDELLALLIDTRVAAAADWCRLQGFLSARQRSARLLASAPLLSPRQRQLSFLPGDELFFGLIPNDGDGISWGRGADIAEADELLACSVDDDLRQLSFLIHEGGRSAELTRYELQAGVRPSVRPICWVELQGALTTESLLSRAPKLLIRASRPLDHARLHLSLYLGDAQRPSASTCVDVYALPCALAESSGIWAELLDGLEVRGAEHLRLELRLGTLWSGELCFEAASWEFWWELVDGVPLLRYEDEDEAELTVQQSSPSTLLAPPTPAGRERTREGIFLFTAARGERSLLHGGLCLTVGRSSLAGGRQAIADIDSLTARIRRRLDSDADGVGIWELAAAYLRWSCASSQRPSEGSDHSIDMFAESVRRHAVSQLHKMLIEALCGHRWAEAEERRHIIDTHELFVELCYQHNMFSLDTLGSRRAQLYKELVTSVLYEQLNKVITSSYATTQQDEDAFMEEETPASQEDDRSALSAFIRGGGIGWAGEGDLYELLDKQLNEALEESSWRCSLMGDHEGARALEEPDAGNTGEKWEVLFRRMRILLGRNRAHDELRHLLQPVSGVAELAELPYEELTQDQLIQELNTWRLRHTAALQGRRWERSEIELIVMLWLNPEGAARAASLPERAIADRAMARAIRYAVLRYLDANQGS